MRKEKRRQFGAGSLQLLQCNGFYTIVFVSLVCLCLQTKLLSFLTTCYTGTFQLNVKDLYNSGNAALVIRNLKQLPPDNKESQSIIWSVSSLCHFFFLDGEGEGSIRRMKNTVTLVNFMICEFLGYRKRYVIKKLGGLL